ncbi:metal ABC transporter permease [Acetivibrio clariflavus]|uniref:ABC-type Mn2+/Zn2+ transport system, permease component n=1 Tax=Acetivibrio clariflavus (strain DSM 19732 / NBRC 101661 / EBR45) TaxID=720554 RepID=G8LX25_ACECE|nr:metal ABC transporter permease [Acetivibrio clariflavus]AEV67677.1 ABC-type Mn2+/Zn2+ transport system, permease component [Acetivibrio clariflavus DSM 19732]
MINFLYSLIDAILPFQWAELEFMKNALLAVLLVSAVFGILGTMIVNNKMAFFSDALGHGAFTGVAVGSIMGIFSPIHGAIAFSIAFSILITVVKNKSKTSTDTIIGVFSSIAISTGLLLLSVGGKNINKYSNYLYGDLLSITPSDLNLLLIAFVGVLLLWLLLFNKMLLISVNQSLARSRGINTVVVETIFTSAIAVIVTVGIQWVGLLLINSLLVLPAAAARNVSFNVRQYHLLSVLFALFSGISGLILSYYWNSTTGATIVLISAGIYFLTLALKNKVG